MCQQKLNSGANFDGTADLIKKLEDDIKEVNRFTRTKMDFNEASRNETKMRQRLEQQIEDNGESSRREIKGISDRLIHLRNEVKLSMLEEDMIKFIKGVKKDWNRVLSRSQTFEDKFNDLHRQNAQMIDRMNSKQLSDGP